MAEKNIWVAAGDGDLNRVRALIEHQMISPNQPDPFTHAAASYGHLDVLQYLISKGGDVNITDGDGDTPLFTAENVATAQFLVEHGARVDILNHQGVSAMEHVEDEFPDVAAYLRAVVDHDQKH